MPVINDIDWTAQDAIELQEHLAELPDNQARIRLLMEAYECRRFFAERYCDILRHVHPQHLVEILSRADVQVSRPTHEEALLLVKALTYSDRTGDVAVGFLPREAA